MFAGSMIDELFNLVQDAERNAQTFDISAKRQPLSVDVHATYLYEFHSAEEFLGAA